MTFSLRTLSRVTMLAITATLLLLPLAAREVWAVAAGGACTPNSNDAATSCDANLFCDATTNTCKGVTNPYVPGNPGLDPSNPYTPLKNCTDAVGTVQPMSSCVDASGKEYGTCDGATGQCVSGLPEMSDYLAVSFIIIAGGMLFYFRRRSIAKA